MKFLRRQLTEKLNFGEFFVNVEVREVEGIGGSLILSISSQELKWMKLTHFIDYLVLGFSALRFQRILCDLDEVNSG